MSAPVYPPHHTYTRTFTHIDTHAQALITTPPHTNTPTHKSGDIAEAAANIQKLHYVSDSNIHKLLALKESCKIMQSLYIDIHFLKEREKSQKASR